MSPFLGTERSQPSTDVLAGVRLLATRARCPACGSRPKLRVTEAERDLRRGQPADALVGSLECQDRRCRAIYPLTAGDVAGAA